MNPRSSSRYRRRSATRSSYGNTFTDRGSERTVIVLDQTVAVQPDAVAHLDRPVREPRGAPTFQVLRVPGDRRGRWPRIPMTIARIGADRVEPLRRTSTVQVEGADVLPRDHHAVAIPAGGREEVGERSRRELAVAGPEELAHETVQPSELGSADPEVRPSVERREHPALEHRRRGLPQADVEDRGLHLTRLASPPSSDAPSRRAPRSRSVTGSSPRSGCARISSNTAMAAFAASSDSYTTTPSHGRRRSCNHGPCTQPCWSFTVGTTSRGSSAGASWSWSTQSRSGCTGTCRAGSASTRCRRGGRSRSARWPGSRWRSRSSACPGAAAMFPRRGCTSGAPSQRGTGHRAGRARDPRSRPGARARGAAHRHRQRRRRVRRTARQGGVAADPRARARRGRLVRGDLGDLRFAGHRRGHPHRGVRARRRHAPPDPRARARGRRDRVAGLPGHGLLDGTEHVGLRAGTGALAPVGTPTLEEILWTVAIGLAAAVVTFPVRRFGLLVASLGPRGRSWSSPWPGSSSPGPRSCSRRSPTSRRRWCCSRGRTRSAPSSRTPARIRSARCSRSCCARGSPGACPSGASAAARRSRRCSSGPPGASPRRTSRAAGVGGDRRRHGCDGRGLLRLPLSAIVIASVLCASAGPGISPLVIVAVVVSYLATLAIEARFPPSYLPDRDDDTTPAAA